MSRFQSFRTRQAQTAHQLRSLSALFQTMPLQWVLWMLIWLPSIVVVVGGVPQSFVLFRAVCEPAHCIDGPRITTQNLAILRAHGWTPDVYAAVYVGAHLQITLICWVLAGLISVRQPRAGIARLAAVSLICFGTTLVPFSYHFALAYGAWAWLFPLLGLVGDVCFASFFFLFPDGRWVPRWALAPVGLYVLYRAPIRLLPEQVGPWWLWNEQISGNVELILLGSMILAQIYRYRWRATHAQRQQTKWVVFGVMIALGTVMLFDTLQTVFPSLQGDDPVVALLLIVVVTLAFSVLPVSIGIAILRYRLWEIDVLLNRTLVYGVLTAATVGLYIFIVGYLGAVFRSDDNMLISLAATGIVAVAFQPLRARIQRGINRLIYGERDEPHTVITRLGEQLESALAPESVLTTVAATVKHALKLPYVQIALAHDTTQPAIVVGQPPPHLVSIPLMYHADVVGELVVAPRAPNDALSRADHHLLHVLAQQVAVAVHAMRLTTDLEALSVDLQRSREQLITAREEERRTLRHELHDGLGATLVRLAQRLDLARSTLQDDPHRAQQLLLDLKQEVRSTVGQVRQVAYSLRPPALDQYGLLTALQEQATRMRASAGLDVTVHAPQELPPLAAAVEVAAYRIVVAALSSVAQHTAGWTCRVDLLLEQRDGRQVLSVDIVDNGDRLAPEGRVGSAFAAMRERAAELGGSCTVEHTADGTRVCVRLPMI